MRTKFGTLVPLFCLVVAAALVWRSMWPQKVTAIAAVQTDIAADRTSLPKPEFKFGVEMYSAQHAVWFDERGDDVARAALLKRAVEKQGERCDGVVKTRAVPSERGAWDAVCAPGYSYELVFSPNVDLKSFRRLY